MRYDLIYDALITRAATRHYQPNDYVEIHHIVPKCLGGSDATDNLVALTPEEHYLAHLLLVKLYPENRKLAYAASMLIPKSPNQRRNNKMYGWLRRKIAAHRKVSSLGENNTQHNTMWITNGVLNRKLNRSENIPIGWSKGRTYPKKDSIKTCKVCGEPTNKKSGVYCETHYVEVRRSQVPWNKGKPLTDKKKQHLSLVQAGSGNSQFGTMWITNGSLNKKINRAADIPNGWSKGRTVK